MGTTAHHGLLALLKEKNRKIEIIGCQPQEGSQIRHPQMARGLSAEDLRSKARPTASST